MKKLNIVFALLLTLTLITGSSSVAVTATSTGGNSSGASLSGFDDSTGDFTVEITSVGPSGLENYTLASDGTYHVVSDRSFNLVRVNVEVTGYNIYDGPTTLGNGTFNGTVANTGYAGELYQIVNGRANVAPSVITSGGQAVDVPIDAAVNTITFLFVGRAQDGSLTWAQDSVVVRVAESADEFSAFTTYEVPFSSSVTDVASTDTQLNLTNLMNINYYSGTSDINPIFDPEHDLTATWTGADGTEVSISGNNIADIVATADAPGSIELSGTVNSSGFVGSPHYLSLLGQLVGFPTVVDATIGHTFFQDVNGLQMLSDADSVTLYTSDDKTDAFAGFGVVTLADFGDWTAQVSADIAYNIGLAHAGIDREAQFGAGSADASLFGTPDTFDVSTPENDPWNQTQYDANFTEYMGGWTGGLFGSNDYAVEDGLFGFNSQAVSEDTVTQRSTVEEGLPGFGIAASLAATMAVAYILPRFRKEN